MSAIVISVIALCVTVVNASAAIANFMLSRFRLLKVREITCVHHNPVNAPPDAILSVDVLSFGAAIWDVEAWVEILVPETPASKDNKTAGWYKFQLLPANGQYLNPLNSGQGMVFILRRSSLVAEIDLISQLKPALPGLPRANISLCIYCGGQRKLLKRIRSSVFRWRLDDLFGGHMNAKLSWWRNHLANHQLRRLRGQPATTYYKSQRFK